MSLIDDLNELDVVPLELQKGTIELLNDYHRLKNCCRAAREEIIRLRSLEEQRDLKYSKE